MSLSTCQALADLPPAFDCVVIGGGITGAGIAHEASRTGARVLLVEQGDFATGTSSASSKLVHGGLRYLARGQWRLTLESVRERNRLLRERAGLVERQPFLMPVYRGMKPGLSTLRTGLAVYDLMGGQWASRRLDVAQALALEPGLRRQGLLGAVVYDDAATDDARLVLKLIFEAVAAGAVALNYTRVVGLLNGDGRIRGVAVQDVDSGECREIQAGIVIDAAGVQAGRLAPGTVARGDAAPMLRPLRGSHLLFPLARLPLTRAVSWLHPRDGRPVFVYPWQGLALYGTTDVDHAADDAPRLSDGEADYLIEGLAHQFPDAALGLADAVSSYAGVRPVVAGGKADPSAESRESAQWSAPGWIGVTGGKLTTFRVTARQVLRAAAGQCPRLAPVAAAAAAMPTTALEARYGAGFDLWLGDADAGDREMIANTPYCHGELRWAVAREQVRHLDDLLLRRTRLGLLLPRGAESLLDAATELCRTALGWDAARCLAEQSRYRSLWNQRHAPVPR